MSADSRQPSVGPLGTPQFIAEMRRTVDRMAGVRVAVIGDLMLDRFHFGVAGRVSREAPVVVLQHVRTLDVPGGAANTAHNVRTLGAGAIVVGCVGTDEVGGHLRTAFATAGIGPADQHLIEVPRWPSTCKVRIFGGLAHAAPQQIARLDYDAPLPSEALATVRAEAIGRLRDVWGTLDACIVSDYGLGVVDEALMREIVALNVRRRIPLTVDTHFVAEHFAGASAVTPNISEVETTLDDSSLSQDLGRLEQQCHDLRERLKLEALLVTRGKYGMTLFESARNVPLHIPAFGDDEVADVTGAGDTVIATYTCALATGSSHECAARLANVAGGLVVMRQGTATVTPAELHRALTGEGRPGR